MPNHYTNMAIVYPDGNITGKNLAQMLKGWWEGAMQRVCPMPNFDMNEPGMNPAWFVWANEHWGTKWDCYDGAEPVALPGDCSAVLVTFCTAWGPPKDDMLESLAKDLMNRGAGKVTWLGLNPYDNSDAILGRHS